ncbi:MAG: hypothetical protein ACT4TC_25130 [Myxococcaceae bacterium]
MSLSRLAALIALGASVVGCNPYDRYTGEVNAGPVDPVAFPPAYLGDDGDRLRSGTGQVIAKGAFVGGTAVDYFQFPLSAALLKKVSANADTMTPTQPIVLATDGASSSASVGGKAYVFDPAENIPFPAVARCTPPSAEYVFDPIAEDVSKAEQGAIFTALPEAKYSEGSAPTWTYNPIYAQVPVTSNGNACQSIKSEKTLLASSNVNVASTVNASGVATGTADGKYLAWAVIDPGAGVYRSTEFDAAGNPTTTGVGIQRWGWLRKYLLAYIDGGYIPTTSVAVGAQTQLQAVAQTLYIPLQVLVDGAPEAGATGQGYDVLDATRSQMGYSPICRVRTYNTGAAVAPGTLPKDAATINTLYGATLADAVPAYVFCLQPN